MGFRSSSSAPPNTPLQQTKPRCILRALKYRACAFAGERQGR
jgi:hypothetical protein